MSSSLLDGQSATDSTMVTTVQGARKVTAWCGICAVVLFACVAALAIDEPTTDASADEVVRYAESNRTALLAAVYCEGLCICASMAFMIGLGVLCGYDECGMSKQDAGRLDGVVRGVPLFSFIGGVTGVSLFTVAAVGFGAVATLALEPSRYASQPELARLLLGLLQLAVNMTGFLTAVSNAAFCVTLARGCG